MAKIAFDLRGLIENSLLEWENKLATVAIAGGCNLRCPYCHSWRYVTSLDDLQAIDHQALFGLLERQRGWIDGVVFTGGEPTLQPGLEEMIRRVREHGVAVKLHTNGTRPEVVEGLLEADLLDCLALDYKAPLDGRFFVAAGRQREEGLLSAVRKSFELAAAADIDVEYHTTLNPAVVTPETFADMTAELDSKGLWILQQYESGDCLSPEKAGRERYEGPELERMAKEAGKLHRRTLLKKGSSG